MKLMKLMKRLSVSTLVSACLLFTQIVGVYAASGTSVPDEKGFHWSYNDSLSARLLTVHGYHGEKTTLIHSDFPTIWDHAWFSANLLLSSGTVSLTNEQEITPGSGLYAFESLTAFHYRGSSANTAQSTTQLESVELPYGYSVIGASCFEAQSNLKKIYLPDSVTTISTKAFQTCKAEVIVFSKNLTEIANAAFYQIANNANLYFRSTTPPVASGPFSHATIPNAVNIYYPYIDEEPTNDDENLTTAQAYESMNWGNNNPATRNYYPYVDTQAEYDAIVAEKPEMKDTLKVLPEDAYDYYRTIGSGNLPDKPTDELSMMLREKSGKVVTDLQDADLVEWAKVVSEESEESEEGIILLSAFAHDESGALTILDAQLKEVKSSDYVDYDDGDKVATKSFKWLIPEGTEFIKLMFWNDDAKPIKSVITNPMPTQE